MIKSHLLTSFLLLAGLTFSQTKKKQSPSYADGRELIRAMHRTYAPDKWYRYFTFSQHVEWCRNDSVIKREVWHEAYKPGSLIIKFGSKDSKTGRLYDDFTSHSFAEGKAPQKAPRVHELLLVGLDVYFFDPESTIRILDSLGYNLNKIRTDEFSGRRVFVVGADKGDDTSRQFWIDQERLYMHRVVYEQKGKISDVVFADYKKMQGNWVARTIIFKTDGKLGLIEKYYDVKFPKSLNPDWFRADKFNEVVLD
jgi:hypothetical protein